MRAADDRPVALPLLLAGLVALAAALTAGRLAGLLSPNLWWDAAFRPDLDDPAQLVFQFSALPRLATAILCGAALGLSGALLQHVLRNPIASPTTLGTEAGAQLAVTLATIFTPALLVGGRELASLAGSGLATAAVFACAASRGLSSLSVILAGLVVALFCASLAAALKLIDGEYASALFLWGGGSLSQQDWSAPAFLLPRLAAGALAAAVLTKPLSLLALDDDGARALGLPVGLVRAGAVALAVFLASSVTAAVGAIGFVGLAAPQLARLAGARRFGIRLLAAPVVGAALLAAVDACVGGLSDRVDLRLPTGAATALLGAPLLVLLLPRLRLAAAPEVRGGPVERTGSPPHLAWLAFALTGALAVSLLLGRTASTWSIASPSDLAAVLPWRLPRIAVALLAGGLLASAGLILQRMTGNPMASPEILGLGTGVAAGLAVALLVFPALDAAARLAAGAMGAAAALAVLLAAGRRSSFAPEHLLLTGIALSALLDALVVSFLAIGDARATELLTFVSGSTYRADWSTVAVTTAAAAVLLPAAWLARRPLDMLPLGPEVVFSLGVPLGPARFALTTLAALMTAAAVLVAGPLTFVGLLGPAAVRLAGFRGAARQLLASALLGGGIMVLADWVGRTAIYPRQLPAGLVAALVGMPFLIWQLARSRG